MLGWKSGIFLLLLLGWGWWNQSTLAQCGNPRYLQTITITNPNAVALTNYVVKLTVNTSALVGAGKLANATGFRFLDSDCVTYLNYWPSDANTFPSATAVYYVKVPSLPALGSKKIQMYYDNLTNCPQSIGNTFSSIGTVGTAPTVGFSAATTWELRNYTFPANATTFRWDVRSANTGNFRPKTTVTISGAQYVQAEGTSRTVAIGTNNYVDELPVDAGGHPGFYTPTLLNVGVNCGLCNSVNSGSGDIPPVSAPLTANVANTAQVQVWYRPRAAAEPTASFGTEYDRTAAVTITPAGAVTACEEDILNFTASTPFINYRWYLDNIFRSAGTATTQSINTAGFSNGVHVLKVVAYTSSCDSVQATKNITINPRPDITALNPDNGCQFDLITLGATVGPNGSTISTYNWDFGDASTGTGATPTHRYTTAANLSLRLVVTTTQGCKDTLVEPIAIYPKPTINSVTETDVCWPNAVLYSNNTTIPTNWNSSTITTYEWRYGDGNNGFGSSSSHAFAVANQYAESLLVTTNVGCMDTLVGSVDVWPKPDIAAISDPNICWPQAASFGNTSSIPNNWDATTIIDYSWHFGDGTTGLGAVTTHPYALPNLYNDSLIVTTGDGCKDSLAETISIWPKPDIDSVTALDQCWPTGTTFTGYHHISNNWNSAAVTVHDWRFGDASTASTNPAFHAYAVPNIYTHTLYVETGNACRDTLVGSINIWPKPSINSLTESDICWPNAVLFTNNTTLPNNWDAATINQYDWRFGDGNTGNTSTATHAFALPNRYFDTLYVRTTDNCRDTLTGSVDVWPKPQIDSIVAVDVCEPEVMNFAAVAQLPNDWNLATLGQYNWDFGDGNVGGGVTTSHQYAAAGTYTVQLIVITTDNCQDTLTKTVRVYPKPVADFVIADICHGDSLLLSNNSSVAGTLGATLVDQLWTFGDGDSSHAANASHYYAFEGLYTVTLVATTNHGCRDTLVQPLNVFPKPNAAFSFPHVCQPDSATFIDASTVSTGTIATYDWDFGDGGSSLAQNPIHGYAVADSYHVQLIVVTDHGCLDTLVRTYLWNPKPVAAFTAANVCFPDSVHFVNQSSLSIGNIESQAWDFGDGNGSNLPSPSHAYLTAGTYNVTLIVTSDSLCSDTLTLPVTANEKPVAAFAPATICWPDTVPFLDQSTIGGQAVLTAWQWTFGDDSTSALQNPAHAYALPDSYDVRLIVWSDSGCTDTLDQQLVAYPRPGLQLGPDTLWLCPFNTLTLHAGPQFSSYSWQDGSTDSTYIVSNPGQYMVTVMDTNGCTQSDTVEAPLAPQPALVLAPDDTVRVCAGELADIDAATAGVYAFLWDDGATSSDIHVGPGDYTVIGWNQYLCSDTASVHVYAVPLPEPDLGPDQGFCAGDTVQVDAGSWAGYAWSTGDTVQLLNFWYSGTFVVTVTDVNGCNGMDTVSVTRWELPYVDLGADRELCAGESLTLVASGFQAVYWLPGGSVGDSLTVTATGSYAALLTDSHGCSDTSSVVDVIVHPLPAAPAITKGDVDPLLVSTPSAGYQWYYNGQVLPGATAQEVLPAASGNYQVMITDTNGCSMLSGIYDLVIEIYDEEMYEGISPNGDGSNDFFVIPEIEYYPRNQLVIFNRWGGKVYEASGYLNQFDGHDDKGNSLADGTYFYVLDLGNGDKPVKGMLVINR